MEDELEPPLPAGLGSLTAAQQALADFLRLDADLLATAATASPKAPSGRDDPRKPTRWIADLPEKDKNALLLRAARGDAGQVHMELLRRFKGETDTGAKSDTTPRSVAELLDATAATRENRERRTAAR
ncbi:hypothetical protein AB0M95_33570 [Sphaerisporangium sp. NPDC051017]|uniref:hypothetical protein n=1 Tax=Sphaerisporangium sp. NPDC051017 TaxID=3154636 RepID=UPI00344AC03D